MSLNVSNINHMKVLISTQQINNAGCMINERTVTSDGKLEMNFATNTLGTYCLTTALLPLLKK